MLVNGGGCDGCGEDVEIDSLYSRISYFKDLRFCSWVCSVSSVASLRSLRSIQHSAYLISWLLLLSMRPSFSGFTRCLHYIICMFTSRLASRLAQLASQRVFLLARLMVLFTRLLFIILLSSSFSSCLLLTVLIIFSSLLRVQLVQLQFLIIIFSFFPFYSIFSLCFLLLSFIIIFSTLL